MHHLVSVLMYLLMWVGICFLLLAALGFFTTWRGRRAVAAGDTSASVCYRCGLYFLHEHSHWIGQNRECYGCGQEFSPENPLAVPLRIEGAREAEFWRRVRVARSSALGRSFLRLAGIV